MTIAYDKPGQTEPRPGPLAAPRERCWGRSTAPTGKRVRCDLGKDAHTSRAALYDTLEGARMHWWPR